MSIPEASSKSHSGCLWDAHGDKRKETLLNKIRKNAFQNSIRNCFVLSGCNIYDINMHARHKVIQGSFI